MMTTLVVQVRRMTLFHVSEEPGIERFDPHAAADGGEPVVWAIDAERLRNYLLPRDCPRVTFHAGSRTTTADVERFLTSAAHTAIIAIEYEWLERLRSCRLYCYHLPPDTFRCIDACAGYFVSRVSVVPAHVDIIDNPIAELASRGVELRIVPTLWPLRDAVVASSLQFSCIRMRNARPRQDSPGRSTRIPTP